LITISELPPSDQRSIKLKPQHTRWLLVDHNALKGELEKVYGGQVVGTIDHHDEENQVPMDCGNEPRIITKTGSCTSLVIQYCREAWDTVSTKSQIQETTSWDAELAYLALAPILIDTNNLKDASKVTATDVEAVQYLESKIDDPAKQYNRDDYFKQISSAKADIGALSLGDILRKDYKQWVESETVNLGISAVVKDMSWLLEKTGGQETFLSTVKQFATDRKLSLYAIMTILLVSEKVQRELFIYALDEKGTATIRVFEEDAAEELGLAPLGEGKVTSMHAHDGQPVWRCWNQSKVENSRKQVAPLLRKAINDA
jgi:exopolyphosphatase